MAMGLDRVFNILDIEPDVKDAPDAQPMEPFAREIRFDDVSFAYEAGRPILRNVSFSVTPGTITAIVGPTGAGKTSLAHLIPGYYLPTTGSVRIDGYDIREISLDSLRRQVSYVFQESQLFSDSVSDNIRYGGAPDVTQDEIEHAARLAGAHDFIMELPHGYAHGYDTHLGTVTSKLSVGQKQRIAIARGLVKDARIMILDEPTSALDPETEAYLVDALHAAAHDKLVIVIAHRLSTISNADRIYFLQDGEIVEQGSHAELMEKQDGHYREYVMLQGTADD